MKPIFSNRYVDAAAKTIICAGVIHVALLAGLALRGEVEVLNAFNIVQLDLWIPSLHSGALNFGLSYVVLAAVYGFVYLFFSRPEEDGKSTVRPNLLPQDHPAPSAGPGPSTGRG